MKRDTSASAARADNGLASHLPLPRLLGDFRPLCIASGVLMLATLLVFGDLIVAGGDRILSVSGTDTWGVFVGWCQFTIAEMGRGNFLPLWNPHLYSGAPCLGGFQEALLYPTNYLLYILPIPQAINFGIILHVFLAGIFTYMWMARRGVHPAAAILAGLLFMFGGGYFMHITAGHLPNLRTMVWAPLILLAIDDITTTRSFRGAWLGSAAVAMQIYAGHPQYTYITALIAGPYALLGVWRSPDRRRALAGLGLMGVGGIALSAMQLFTGLAATQESIRSGLRFDVAKTFPFPPENLVTLVMPGFFGQISDKVYWGRWLLWEDCLFIGVAGLALAVYGVIRGEKSQRPRTLFFFLLAAMLIAFGNYTPLYRLLYAYLPGVNSFRGISKVAFMAALFLANLAGVGFDRLLREKKISPRPPFVILALAIVAAAIGALVLRWGIGGASGTWAHLLFHIHWFAENYPGSSTESATFFQRSSAIAARALFWSAGAGAALAICWFAATKRRGFIYAIGVLAAIELVSFAWQNRFTFPMAEVKNTERQLQASLAKLPPDARMKTDTPSDVLGIGADEGWGNDPMVLRRYAEFMDINQDRAADELPTKGFTRPSRNWGIARIYFPTLVRGTEQWATGQPRLARAQLIESVEIIPDGKQMLARIADRSFDPRRTVLLEVPVDPMPSPAESSSGPPGTAHVNDLSTDEVEVTANVLRPSVLLITDTYSKEWRVIPIDDAPIQHYEIVPADHAFRGIALHPGRHHFILEFRPRSFVVGTWVTLMSMIVWLCSGVVLSGWISRKPRTAGNARRQSSRKTKPA